jgi:RNA polymerase sigma-70 factor (ECF subfamily)
MSMVTGDVEREISASLQRGALEEAAVSTLRAYSDELLGYLIGFLRDPEEAREVFAMFAEDLWSSLRQLTLRTTMRAYCYALARHTAYRYLDRDVRRQRRAVPLSAADVVSRAVAASRTQTPTFALSETKQQVALLRERLSREEQEVLTLRVDRGLDWREVAEALGSDETDLTTAVARHRKRFQLIKQKLARWAREEGIVPTPEES